jgi:MoaA/NifB/PqqE/SkfB family radical SAM enzyme
MPILASHDNGDLAMNCCITRANMRSLEEAAIRCQEWGVSISYSAYSTRRTGNADLSISSEDDLEALEKAIQNLIDMRRDGVDILNPPSILLDIHRFFKEGGTPNCSAGRTFLVVRPEGILNPCSMHRNRRYDSRKEMIGDFTNHNKCKGCYVAIRAYSDKSIGSLFRDAIEFAR